MTSIYQFQAEFAAKVKSINLLAIQIKVVDKFPSSKTLGRFVAQHGAGWIEIRSDLVQYPDTLRLVIGHELAHAIQFLRNEKLGHQGNFNHYCAILGISGGTTITVPSALNIVKKNTKTRYYVTMATGTVVVLTKQQLAKINSGARFTHVETGERINADTIANVKEFTFK